MLRFSNRRRSVPELVPLRRPERPSRRVGWALLTLVMLLSCARRSSVIPSAPPARAVIISAEAAQRLSDRCAAALAQSGPFQLTIAEEELASYLALNAGEGPLRGVALWLTHEGAYLSARLELGRGYPLAALVTLTSDRGQPRMRLLWLTVAGHSAPRWIQASLEQALNDALADARLPLHLEEAIWDEGSLTLIGAVP